VLELDDGTRLCDIVAISQYLDETFPEPNLMGRSPLERAVIAMWNRRVLNEGFGSVAECLRNSSEAMKGRALTGAFDYEQIPELAERGRRRVRNFFAELNERLRWQKYIAVDRFTIADISALVTVDFAKFIMEPIPEEVENLRRWFALISLRPGSVS
jgi:glutathione S-transferase